MTLHFPDEVATNILTIDATDPKSGTAEFKAAAIRVEKLTGLTRDSDRQSVGVLDRRSARAHGPALIARRRRASRRQSALRSDALVSATTADPGLGRRRSRDAPTTTGASPRDQAADVARERAAHLLLPALHAVQSRVGWISPARSTTSAQRLDVPPAEA